MRATKKETAPERRARFKRAGLCANCGKRKPQLRRKGAGRGRYTECRKCRAYQKAWTAAQK